MKKGEPELIKNRLVIERNNYAKDGWYVSVDDDVKYVETLDEAADMALAEIGADAISAERDGEVAKLTERVNELKESLDKSCAAYERINADLEQERADKTKWILEAYELKETLVKMCKRFVRA